MSRRNVTRSLIRVLGISLAVLPVLASPLLAPSASASAVVGLLPDAPPDSLLILLPPRAMELVQQDLATAEAKEGMAKTDLASAQGRLAETKALVDVRKGEIETTKAQVKLAKEQKNQTEQDNLELEVKAKELRLKVLQARVEMRQAEVKLADARRETAQTQSGFLKKELELLGKRNDLSTVKASPGETKNLDALVRLQTEVRDLERRCLEIARDAAEKAKSEAEDESSLLDKRLKLQEGQSALIAGPRK